MAIETVDIPDNNHYRVLSPDMAHGQSPGPDNTMVPGDSTGHTIRPDPCDGTALSHHQVTTWAGDINTDSHCGRIMDSDMVFGSISGPDVIMAPGSYAEPPDWHVPHGQNGLCTPMWHQVDPQTTGPCTVPSRVRSRRHQHRHLCLLHGPETTWSLVIVQTQTPP